MLIRCTALLKMTKGYNNGLQFVIILVVQDTNTDKTMRI